MQTIQNIPELQGQLVQCNTERDFMFAVEMFLKRYGSRRETIRTYRNCLRQFSKWVNDTNRDYATLQHQDIVDFQSDLLTISPRHKVNTVNLYLSAVRELYTWLEANGIYHNIARATKRIQKEKRFKMHLTLEQSKAVLKYFRNREPRKRLLKNGEEVNAFPRFELIRARDYAMVNLMLRTGLRTIEVARLSVSDMTERNGRTVLIVEGKGVQEHDENNFVILSRKSVEPIEAYLNLRHRVLPTDPLFPSEGYGGSGPMTTREIQKIVKTGFRAVGLTESLTPHCLRHTTGVQILLNGGNIFDVQTVLRHSDPATSEIYTKSIAQEKRLENAPDLIIDNIFDDERRLTGAVVSVNQYRKKEATPHFSYIQKKVLDKSIEAISALTDPKYSGVAPETEPAP